MRGIPIDILRAFVAVVEARGFTRAARELGRTQPTISLQVKRLEELVEAPLFKKSTHFGLSSVGEICFDYGKRLLRLHDDMLDEVAGLNNPNGAMRVGIPSEFASILAPRLDRLRADAEIGAAFDVIVDSSHALSAAFRQNALDVAFLVGTGESEPHKIEQWRGQLRWFGGTFDAFAGKSLAAACSRAARVAVSRSGDRRAARPGEEIRNRLHELGLQRARRRRRRGSWRYADGRGAGARETKALP